MTLRVALRYCHGSIPINIEVEGEALTPDSIPNILCAILEPLESWLETFTRKSRGLSSGESTAQSQQPKASHSPLHHSPGFLAESGPKEAEAPKGDSQHEL